ncbi:hypothetical protein THAOC_33368 [Thalassiosira oceanica]|uniref:U3 small nucleolar RNA-associated protein 13 C-terminal domain-containing protein n=1 Tax=Thalassiosira oceanica TaxID=159749 RepID=K0R499_THAOC|nr:hypothetical protein THAOC_33368 [Thalassiosira oceanica]|eukprot:EJK47883.1 hypothetical protein THAOC_33368 [Thalassiosira oceanica]
MPSPAPKKRRGGDDPPPSSSDSEEGTTSSSSPSNESGTSESSSSGDDESENDGLPEQEQMKDVGGDEDSSSGSVSEEDEGVETNESTTISKSWAALTTHSPCYTGGSVIFSHPPSPSSSPSTSAHEQQHFILAQRGGDVAVIEASTGLLLRTVRKGRLFQGANDLSGDYDENEDAADDEDDMLDADDITAFALSPNNIDLVAVTRGHLVQKYSLNRSAVIDAEDKPAIKSTDEKEDRANHQSVTSISDPAKITFTFGKSGHRLPVTHVAFHPSGVFFATGSVDGLVKIWDVRSGYATHALHPTSSEVSGNRGRYAVTCVEWRQSASSLILAIGREDGSISIHDLLLNAHDTKKASMPLTVLRDHMSAVTCVAWSTEAGVGFNPTVSDAARGSRRHGGGVFFSSGRDSVVNTWLISEEESREPEPPKKKKKKTSKGDRGSPLSISYRRIRTLPVYEQVESMLLLPRRFRPTPDTKAQNKVLDRKDVVLATCGTKGVVRLWKATPGDKDSGAQQILSDLTPLLSETEGDAFGEENGGYTSLHLANVSTTHKSPLLVAVDAEHNMTFLHAQWESADAKLEFTKSRTIVGHNGEILDLSVIPSVGPSEQENDHHTIAIATNSSQVRLFGLEHTKEDEEDDSKVHTALSPRGLLDGHTAIVLSIDTSPCGRFVATGSKDRTMRLWEVATQKCVAVATGHTEALGSVALSRKVGCYDVGGKVAESGAGAFVVTASKDRTLKIWPLPGSAVLSQWSEGKGDNSLRARLSARAHEKDINIVTVAPNDALVATGSQDKQVKLWRPADLALHGSLKGHKRGVWDVQFAPHDRLVATASGDRTIKLWSMSDCKCLRTFQGHMQGVLRVRFLNGGLQLISSGSDGLLKLWTIKNNECESTIDAHDDKVWALDISPCGGALFSGGADSKIAVWRDTTKEREDAARDAEEQNILMEQRLSNHLRHKQYEQALELALELEKPNQVLKVLTEIVEKDAKRNEIVTLRKHAASWSVDVLKQILRYCREWNTRARNSHIAMLVVKAVVTTVPAVKLASYEGLPEIMAGILPYAERHFERLDKMVGNSYLLDYTLFSMGSLHGSNTDSYNEWLEKSKYLLPPSEAEGRIQVGGSLIVHGKTTEETDESEDEVLTIGTAESDDGDDESSSGSSSEE